MHAARRLETRAQWQQTTLVAEYARRRAAQPADAKARGIPKGRRPGEFPDDELAAELLITRNQAAGRIEADLELTGRLPRTYAGMADGTISAGRADTIAAATGFLSDEDAARADEILAAAAPGLRVDQLGRKAAALEMKLDPEAARIRKEHAKSTRQRVEVRRELSGNASIAGRELDTATALACKANIDAVAVRLRNHGHLDGTLSSIRALVLTELLQGRDPLGLIHPGPGSPPSRTRRRRPGRRRGHGARHPGRPSPEHPDYPCCPGDPDDPGPDDSDSPRPRLRGTGRTARLGRRRGRERPLRRPRHRRRRRRRRRRARPARPSPPRDARPAPRQHQPPRPHRHPPRLVRRPRPRQRHRPAGPRRDPRHRPGRLPAPQNPLVRHDHQPRRHRHRPRLRPRPAPLGATTANTTAAPPAAPPPEHHRHPRPTAGHASLRRRPRRRPASAPPRAPQPAQAHPRAHRPGPVRPPPRRRPLHPQPQTQAPPARPHRNLRRPRLQRPSGLLRSGPHHRLARRPDRPVQPRPEMQTAPSLQTSTRLARRATPTRPHPLDPPQRPRYTTTPTVYDL